MTEGIITNILQIAVRGGKLQVEIKEVPVIYINDRVRRINNNDVTRVEAGYIPKKGFIHIFRDVSNTYYWFIS